MEISKEEYQRAKKLIEEYEMQTNKSLIKDHICICCKKNKITPLCSDITKLSEQEKGMWNNGTVEKISFGYGSIKDTNAYIISICDECIENLEKGGLSMNIRTLKSEEKKYYDN